MDQTILENLRHVLSMLLTAKSNLDTISLDGMDSKSRKNIEKAKKEIVSGTNKILEEIERIKA